jgi:hypothetical protein
MSLQYPVTYSFIRLSRKNGDFEPREGGFIQKNQWSLHFFNFFYLINILIFFFPGDRFDE